MKLRKYEITVICISLSLLMFTIGYFVGRGSTDAISVETNVSDITADEVVNNTAAEQDDDDDLPEAAEKINLNTATAKDLEKLPGIGEVLASRILEYREAHGGFDSVAEILNVSGIGSKKFAAIKDSIVI